MSCSHYQVRQLWWTVSLLNREKFFLNLLRNSGDPNTKGVSLEVEGIRAAVTVAVVIANQNPLSCF